MSYIDKKTTAVLAFADGFDCIAVVDLSITAKDVIDLLINEGSYDLLEGLESKPKGHYLVIINYWYETESGGFFTEIESILKIDYEW